MSRKIRLPGQAILKIRKKASFFCVESNRNRIESGSEIMSTVKPSPTTIAWSWVVEELANSPQIDSSLLAAIVKQDRSIIDDPCYGDTARKRLVLKFLEEILESSEEQNAFNIFGDSSNKPSLNTLRQAVQRKKAALPKPSFDLLKHNIIEECLKRKPASPVDQAVSKRRKSNADAAEKPRPDSDVLPSKSNLICEENIQADELENTTENPDEAQAVSERRKSNVDAAEKPRPDSDVLPSKSNLICEENIQADEQENITENPDEEEREIVPDSLMDQRSCMKCDEGCDLLICSEINCMIAVHRRCLSSTYNFDESEGFKCPTCAYQWALSDYDKARKRFYLAKEAFYEFVGWDHEEKNGDPSNSMQLNQSKNTATENLADAVPSETSERDNEQQGLSGHEQKKELESGKDEVVGKQDHDVKEKDSKVNVQKSPLRGKSKKRVATRGPKRYSNPVIPCARRTRLPWTEDEEAILKEAMQKFHQKDGRQTHSEISWIRIWDYGKHVFHRTRQPVDLKDKWRNIKLRDG